MKLIIEWVLVAAVMVGAFVALYAWTKFVTDVLNRHRHGDKK